MTTQHKLKFAANISTSFKETANLEDRYHQAKLLGFRAVECQEPYDVLVDRLSLKRTESGLQQVLINVFSGSNGEKGFAAACGKQEEFRESLERAITYARALDCKIIHIMSGFKSKDVREEIQDATYCDNLQYAGKRLQQEGIVGVIEPVNSKITIPNYYLDDPEKALKIVEAVGLPNIKLLLDLFHLQISHGHLTEFIKRSLPYVGHVQISQVPGRGEPSSPGELDYRYLLGSLQALRYDGWIGLEYFPTGKAEDSFKWIHDWGFSL